MSLELIERLRLHIYGDRKLREQLHTIIGFWPHNISPYKLALMHRGGEYLDTNNERLEFLGDAVLSAVVAHVAYRHFAKSAEGELTKVRSRIVSRESLNHIAHELGIERLLQNVHKSQIDGTNLGGNALEALMGAIYLDQGYEACQRFVCGRLLHRFVSLDQVVQEDTNYKSRLLEFCQKRRLKLEYRIEAMTDRQGLPQFRATAIVNGKEQGTGIGSSKKAASQEAAGKALKYYLNKQRKRA